MFGKTSYDCWFKKVLFNIKKKKNGWENVLMDGWIYGWIQIEIDEDIDN